MSFSMQVKNELVTKEYENSCCNKALLYGMCIFGRSFSTAAVSLQTENEAAAQLYGRLLLRLFNIDAEISVSPGGRNYTVSVKIARIVLSC